MKLNIGCGKKIMKNCINIDILPYEGVDLNFDLKCFPWPLKSNTFDDIYAYSILEHLPDLVKTMEEIHRISKPYAKIHIIVPYYRDINAYSPVHLKFFTEDTFKYFTELKPRDNWITKVRFKILKMKYVYRYKIISFLPAKIIKVINQITNNLISDIYWELEVVK